VARGAHAGELRCAKGKPKWRRKRRKNCREVAARAAVVVRPKDPDEVAAVVRLCHEAGVPVTAAAGRSGVLGGSVPVHGGVVLDLCDLVGIRSVDDTSLTVDVLAGTFGDRFEAELRETYGLTCGHWPQSMSLSTVGGWAACRGAGQLSTRYGKIEDIVVGLDVVLADGTQITTGGAPRQALPRRQVGHPPAAQRPAKA
jgi:alkyldihydroxyacetonephosphate synthase